MGEHKFNRKQITEDMAVELARIATDRGHLVELGWISMLLHVIPKDSSPTQVSEMRKAFFLGAEHLYASIITVMDEGEGVTEKDLERMANIHDELQAFRKEVTTHHTAPGRQQ